MEKEGPPACCEAVAAEEGALPHSGRGGARPPCWGLQNQQSNSGSVQRFPHKMQSVAFPDALRHFKAIFPLGWNVLELISDGYMNSFQNL